MPKAANDNVGEKPASTLVASHKRCPICGKAAQHDTRPFCSKRCADVDLHRWLGETYSIPASENDETPPDAEPFDP